MEKAKVSKVFTDFFPVELRGYMPDFQTLKLINNFWVIHRGYHYYQLQMTLKNE